MTGPLTSDDQLAIRDTIARYAWALDTGDVDGFVACFCRDGLLVWDTFEESECWHGAQALRHFAEFFRSLPSSAGRQDHVSNTLIEPCEEGARSRSYVAVALRRVTVTDPAGATVDLSEFIGTDEEEAEAQDEAADETAEGAEQPAAAAADAATDISAIIRD